MLLALKGFPLAVLQLHTFGAAYQDYENQENLSVTT